MQYNEGCDGHDKGEDVEPLQRDTSGEQDLRGEEDREVGDDADDCCRNPNEDGPEPAVVGQEFSM